MIEIISGIYLLGAVIAVWILLYLVKHEKKKYKLEIKKREILAVSTVAFLCSWVGVFVLWQQKRK